MQNEIRGIPRGARLTRIGGKKESQNNKSPAVAELFFNQLFTI